MDNVLQSLIGGVPVALILAFLGNRFLKQFENSLLKIDSHELKIELMKKDIEIMQKQLDKLSNA